MVPRQSILVDISDCKMIIVDTCISDCKMILVDISDCKMILVDISDCKMILPAAFYGQ
jgi:hypothetical protein